MPRAPRHGKELARRDPEGRRRLIIAVATRHLAERGYETTSVNEVAREAGVSVGTLYKYFPDKPALLEAVLDDFQQDFVAAMDAVHRAPGTHRARLKGMVDGLFELASGRPHFYWALTSGTHGLRGEREFRPGQAIREHIARFIRSGIAAGEFRRVDPELVAALAFGVVETAMRECFSPAEQGARREAWSRAVLDLLVSSVEKRPGERRG